MSGGTVKYDADYGQGGNVFGAGQGDTETTDFNLGRVGGNSTVNITSNTVLVEGNVYGGGDAGSVTGNSNVIMSGGTVGVIGYDNLVGGSYTKAVHTSGGRLFGGGRGNRNNAEYARVNGNANVTISGGHVLYNVYGGGELGSVGQHTPDPTTGDFLPVDNTGLAKVTITGGQVGPAPKTDAGYNIPIALDGTDGYVFGGGKGVSDDWITVPTEHPYSGQYYAFANVNNTEVTIQMGDWDPDNNKYDRIWGSSFGGAEDGHVLGDAKTYFVSGLMGTKGSTSYDGNIFGGGRNYSKANYNAGRVRGNTEVEMTGGQIYGNIYGGGRLALTGVDLYGNILTDVPGSDLKYGHTHVMVKGGKVGNDTPVDGIPFINTFTEHAIGDVYGGGMGDMEGIVGHPKASALLVSLVKNTKVEISEVDPDVPTRILGTVFGGGELASVGQFTWNLNVDDPLFVDDPDDPAYDPNHPTAKTIGDIQLVAGTGKAEVIVRGGTIGVDRMNMSYELVGWDGTGEDNGTEKYKLKYNYDIGHVFGGGEGKVDDPGNYATINPSSSTPDIHSNKSLLDLMASVGETDVTISGSAWVKGAVYGGAYSGHVMRDTKVTIEGGQIGAGNNTKDDKDEQYENIKFVSPLNYATLEDITAGDTLSECVHWGYDKTTNHPFDAIAIYNGINYTTGTGAYPTDYTYKPSDGSSWFGNVFGGGSGYYPYYKETTPGSGTYQAFWNRESGKVYGNATVVIKGGHILTSVYGGCEATDVGHFTYPGDPNPTGGEYVSGGKTTVRMVGGTVGVPRTIPQITAHPVTCYLFGAGKGDPRTNFNTWTNVHEAYVTVMDSIKDGSTISSPIIYGSLFGGGEDGHVFGDVTVNMNGGIIGTTGRSSYDGEVYGGGRGFSGEALTAGVVAGNVNLNIGGGTMLGSVYGGGSLASVGTYLVPPTHANYGKMQQGDSHGNITVEITGGTIGNDYESKYQYLDHTVGGNVYAGGMGRIMELDDATTNPKWHLSGRAKSTTLNISQDNTNPNNRTTIKGNVYGGGEIGVVGGIKGDVAAEEDQSTHVTISGGTLWRDVYGGGYGSNRITNPATLSPGVTVTPMQMAARVMGNTNVTISGGWIKKSVYGGGEMASVGTVTDSIRHISGETVNAHIINHPLYLSWPYEFIYAEGTGKATVEITGGRIGVSGKDYLGPWSPTTGNPYDPSTSNDLNTSEIKAARLDNGDIYGGGKGQAGATYIAAHMGNVKETEITINDATTTASPTTYKPDSFVSAYYSNLEDWETYGALGCITGAVYGGAEDGHVNEDTEITLTNGLVGHAMYGGGKGKGQYTPAGGSAPVYSLTAGKVYGNTEVTIDGGYVVRSVFGGGNLASTGKGNYLGLTGGESSTDASIIALAAASGQTTVKINGGTLGMLNPSKPSDVFKDNIPYGSVFGGARGVAMTSSNVGEHHFGFVNKTVVTIGQSIGNTNNPRIYGSVYGGSQDGHVRRTTDVTVNNGEIGVEYENPAAAKTTMGVPANITEENLLAGNIGLDNYNWTERGNVFGGGSGLGASDEDLSFDDAGFYVPANHAVLAGSVFERTEVKIKGGLIHRDVYGGGNLASVLGQGLNPADDKVKVTISNNAKVGLESDIIGSYYVQGGAHDGSDTTIYFVYGGDVYGAGKGFATNDFEQFCNVNNTDVTVNGGNVYGDVYGGGENGHVVKNTNVMVTENASIGVLADGMGGTTTFDGNVFGGGWGSGEVTTIDVNDPEDPDDDVEEFRIFKHCGRVGGNTNVTMDGGHIQGSIFGGGRLALVGVDVNGDFTPYENAIDSVNYGLATINVSGTYAEDTETYSTEIGNNNGYILLTGSDESVGDIFGSGKGDVKNYEDILAGRVANTKINITGSPRIYGAVFGGGEMASIGYWHEVGGKQVFYDNSGTSEVTVGSTGNASDNLKIGSWIELRHDYAFNTDNPPSKWTIFEGEGEDKRPFHTCTGNVFGGSQGDVDLESPHWVSMGRSRTAKVVINGGTIMSDVTGGAEQGSVIGNTYIQVNGGSIGSVAYSDLPAKQFDFGHIFAAGYGSDDEEEDNSVIPNDSTAVRTALGLSATPLTLAGRVYGNSQVDILGGTIRGEVYGGGGMGSVGYEKGNTTGNTLVNIGKKNDDDSYEGSATIIGSVYAANNREGTPYGNVTVNVYKTNHTGQPVNNEGGDAYPNIPSGMETASDTLAWLADLPHNSMKNFAIRSVFGGSNQANYTPKEGKEAKVHVYQCNDNTIYEVYGGSNAADIGSSSATYPTNAYVIIDGGRFYRVFGGGNGQNTASNIHGTANTEVNGGLINQVFGGSNSDGIIDEINLNVNYGGSCPLYVEDVFSGGNAALVLGDVVTTVECCDASYGNFYGGTNLAKIYGNVTVNIFGATYNNLFAGSKGQLDDPNTTDEDETIPADIKQFPVVSDEFLTDPTQWPDPESTNPMDIELRRVYQYMYDNYMAVPRVDLRGHGGNVTLNIFGGIINEAAFGGCDVNGNIEGKIQVNVFNTGGHCDLDLQDLYGAGRNTNYTPLDPTLTSPEVNVIHGWVRGNVYGGGQGSLATTNANPVVNIGYTEAMGDPNVDRTLVNTLMDTIAAHINGWANPLVSAYTAQIGEGQGNSLTGGDVFGGGNRGAVTENTSVNIAKANTLVRGSVYGGGKGSTESLVDGRVGGNTQVDMTHGTINGNIFGGGNLAQTGIGADGNMQDDVADDPATPADETKTFGNTKVMVRGGTVGNSTIIETFTDYSIGNIYGGGKGYLDTETPGSNSPEKSLLFGLTKNTEIQISDALGNNTHVYGIVLGGGEIASVGSYTLTKDGSGNITKIDVTEGATKVRIGGGIIGGDRTLMRPDTYEPGSPWLYYNDDLGYVYGGGEGWSDDPASYPTVQENATSMSLLDLIATVQSTEVTISGGWVKASVFGGSESGHVRGNTKVTIAGGTIGAGNSGSADVLYDDADFLNPSSTTWYPTAHWPYAAPYTPFDPALLSQDITPSDGRSWFGNVFGGGSGWFPYVTGDAPANYESHWNPLSGKVWGDTEVNITGGHILNNVYGANESTDVGGKATVKISGGTVGVPLSDTEYQDRPMLGYVFGGGAGDPRRIFNTTTNVDTTDVQITGGTIYGAVFGGAEMGHVVRGASVSISEADGTTVIGSTGFSGYDGHVFGGGKGDDLNYDPAIDNSTDPPTSTPNFACGRVGGNTKVTMTAGTVLGNVYGGGMIARTGVGEEGGFETYVDGTVYDSIHHGLTQVELSGGTIGNPVNDGLTLLQSSQISGSVYGGGRGKIDEYREDDYGRAAKAVVTISNSPTIYGSVFGGGQMANIGHWNNYESWYTKGTGATSVTITDSPTIGTAKEFEYSYYQGSHPNTRYETVNTMTILSHTRTGNVYGGGEGSIHVDAHGYAEGLEQGHCRTTSVDISGTPTIMSSVFGGSEQGAVWGDTKVVIAGGTIGQEGLTSDLGSGSTGTYSFGSVFGGSFGEDGNLYLTGTTNAIDSICRLSGRVYRNTHVSITGGAVKGNVFGGGDMASVGQWTNVMDGDNLIDFAPAKDQLTNQPTGKATVSVSGKAIIGPMDGTGLNAYVYGGGKGLGNDPYSLRKKYCNINSTEVTVGLTYANPTVNPETSWSSATDGRIYGSIYGGGPDCHVLGNTKVVLNSGVIGTYVDATQGITAYGGNIFGSGRNFLKTNYSAGRVAGNTEIEMNGGYVYGTIFGGGRHAVTGTDFDGMNMRDGDDHGKTIVKVKGGTVGYEPIVRTFTQRTIGEVYGGGKGNMEGIAGHPAASTLLVGLVKNTEVEISGSARVYGNVFGGGEVGNVGKYTWSVNGGTGNIENVTLVDGTGVTDVSVKGNAIIGVDNMKMSYELVGGDGADKYSLATNSVGGVFGGGKGVSGDPTGYDVVDAIINTNHYDKYLLDLMATVGSANVTIDGSAWVKGSVYGGAAMGHVMGNTDVKIQGGQIGAGYNFSNSTEQAMYADDAFIDASTTHVTDGNALHGTYHWDYDANLNPFDLVAIYNGMTGTNYPDDYGYKPSDGKTWFGNVFGGGSGFLPYVKNGQCEWNRDAGKVYGHSNVTISGGHILSNVYGGCETSDVGLYSYSDVIHGEEYVAGGTATVTMTGGTIGVPRTTAQIQAHPIPGYLYGSGKGDPRLYFNTWTNVHQSVVSVSGGKIYGSVFGGGEDGHVMGNVTLAISEANPAEPTVIGSTGISGSDGNVFGAGRGTTAEALTAGTVSGNIGVGISDGKILGSVYGGGSRASVGTYLVDKEYGEPSTENEFYGKIREGADYGFITLEVSGGTIGNTLETPSHEAPNTIGGNVYGGSRGEFIAYSGSGVMPIWPSLARAKQTTVTIKGSAVVKNSVFGGGEMGTVRNNATVYIQGGTIGGAYNGMNCGHVFGGGKGFENISLCSDIQNDSAKAATYLAGRVYGNTFVYVSGGQVNENVFGGGQVASVGWVKDNGTLVNGQATVEMTGGIVGPLDMTGLNGYIFGGPKGINNAAYQPYCNVNSTSVEVNYTTTATNRLWGSIFGGGSDGHVLGNAEVTLIDGTVGTYGITGYDGNIFGGGRNYQESGLTAGRVGGNITVTMEGGALQGSIFGGGRQGLTGVDVDGTAVNDANHGNITVSVTGGTIGNPDQMGSSTFSIGDVFGGGKGQSNSSTEGFDHNRLGEVRSTLVTIGGGTSSATVNGSVYGGSENGWVLQDATTTIAANATIGRTANTNQGNVFGGGRGVDTDVNPSNVGQYNPNAGRVDSVARVNINGGLVKRYVFGGGDKGIVEGERIVNVNGGTIGTAGEDATGDVYGGSNAVPDNNSTTPPTPYTGHGNLKTVNVRGGTILGDVYGSSRSSNEGTGADTWSSFVNITGGTIGDPTVSTSGNVYGAGYEGKVNGSVSVNIGLAAIQPTINTIIAGNTSYKDGLGGSEPTPAVIKIQGSVFDGSNYFGEGETAWNTYDIEGSSYTFLDGTGYDTEHDEAKATVDPPYMNIAGGLYGSGTHCESGKTGRQIRVRNYGKRSLVGGGTAMSDATRTLTTIQRGGIVLLDNANLHFSGAPDISGQFPNRIFGVLQVDNGFYSTNGSGIVLGVVGSPAYMDSIREVRSLYLKDNAGTSYDQIDASDNTNWEVVGIQDNTANPGLYRTVTDLTTPLTFDQENVIIFNGDSRLMVRYYDASANKVMYGELNGFFRMRADAFPVSGLESFAYARPKLTNKVNPLDGYDVSGDNTWNAGDGGFLSYDNSLNNFTTEGTMVLGHEYTTTGDDGGTGFNKTKQYPYFNLSKVTKDGDKADINTKDYRVWALPITLGQKWYVDGRGIGYGGWGKDDDHKDGWGAFPDKPKLTVSGPNGIYNDATTPLARQRFNAKDDIIFVVGPIDALEENENLNLAMQESDQTKHYPLRLYRYPGGHKLSNETNDAGGGTAPDDPSWNGVTSGDAGPGVNKDAMILANKTSDFVLDNVVVDGLYEYESAEITQLDIPDTYGDDKKLVSSPMVVTTAGAQLTLKGSQILNGESETVADGTILRRGYNNIDASGAFDDDGDPATPDISNYYLNSDYAGDLKNGGALNVNATATVKVEGLVNIQGNKQKNDGGVVESNVYLPTFGKYLEISNALEARTSIGITSPIRNTADNYVNNTFSPVAKGVRTSYEAADAELAYTNNNFSDDLEWFFVNGYTNENKRTTYYDPTETSSNPNPTNANLDEKTLFFGWTWANVVRTEPDGFELSAGNYVVDSKDDMAWLINKVKAGSFTGSVTQTEDLDLQQYVWVPVGAHNGTTVTRPFSGTFDGKGHLIKNMAIDYIGKGDRQYEYDDYGLFGWVVDGTINRTFVVDGLVRPVGKVNMGGLVGTLEANTGTPTLKNSEAAASIVMPALSETGTAYVGGLVGLTNGATIHSSMAMPDIECNYDYGKVGGLVGGNTSANSNVLNSFANAKFNLSDNATAGGLVGDANTLTLKNCYVNLYDKGNLDDDGSPKSFDLLVGNVTSSAIDYCYAFRPTDVEFENNEYSFAVTGTTTTTNYYFSPVASTDNYGYMYMDNQLYQLEGSEWVKKDSSMFVKLNRNIVAVLGDNEATHEYARWTRPTLSRINGDYPVLMLDNYDGSSNIGLGGFRSVANYAGGPALQYGGPVRDATSTKSSSGEIDEAISRMEASDELLIYGDITTAPTEPSDWSTFPGKIAIHEDAAIMLPGTFAETDANVYVGVTFDNSSREAHDAYGNVLHRDWHMFSTPLANAPLGMDYTLGSTSEDQNLNGVWNGLGDPGNQYVYYPSSWAAPYLDSNLPIYDFTDAGTSDGYFPYVTAGYTKPTGELYAYPYDFYTWYEPDWQWINFKRNGPSHWHYDEVPGTTQHPHIDYKATPSADENKNETSLVPGKGYMMAIHDNTFMQSHGYLNNGNVEFTITNSGGESTWTWVPLHYGYFGNNFVGNPYHAYLDFDAFGAASALGGNDFTSYYTYDADTASLKGIDYLIYAGGGSSGGCYASRYLHPHQGFFLQTADVSKTITFKNDNVTNFVVSRSDAENATFRDWRPNYPLVNLFAYDNEGRGDVVVIEFNRPENGGGKKVKTLRSGNHLIYAHNEDTDYGAFFAKEGTSRVPVRFLSFESETKPYTLRWDTHNGFFNSLYLIDNLLGVTYDMLANDSYTFVGSKEDYVSRFVIVFDVTDVEENNDTNLKTFAFNDGNSWVVNGTGRLEVIDVTGRILYTEDLHNEQNHVNLNRYAKGVYLLRLWSNDKARIQKIVLH